MDAILAAAAKRAAEGSATGEKDPKAGRKSQSPPAGSSGGGGGPAAKSKGRGNKQSGGNLNDDQVLSVLVRDHLHMRDDVDGLKASHNIMFFITGESMKKDVQEMSDIWTKDKPAFVKDAPQPKHPLGCSKRYMLLAKVLTDVSKLADPAPPKAFLDACNGFMSEKTEVAEQYVTTFKSRYNKFDAKRPWIFTLTLAAGTPERYYEFFNQLVGYSHDQIRICRETPRQSKEANQLWGWLKNNSK